MLFLACGMRMRRLGEREQFTCITVHRMVWRGFKH